MPKVTIEQFINGLQQISDEEFVPDHVYQHLSKHPVEVDSITRYLHWSPNFYTRNLVYKDDRFEVMVICWEKGQVSRVHDHADQKCWMMVPVGRLRGQNFAIAEIDPANGFCRLNETNSFELTDCLSAKVELEEPIHQILNLPEFDERAVSIHIYSHPIERCNSYCLDTNSFKEVTLSYTSIDGRLC